MELVTPDHPSILGNLKPSLDPTITFNPDRISFSTKAKFVTGYDKGDRVTFVLDTNRLYFFKSKEGFPISLMGADDRRAICSQSLIVYIFSKLPGLRNLQYAIKKTASEINGEPQYEVLMYKKIPQVNRSKKTKK